MQSEAFWEDEIARMGLPEMPIKMVNLNSEEPIYCEANIYYDLMEKFLKKIGFSQKCMESLWKISLTRNEIVKIRSGKLPENLDVIFKTPIQYGGKLEIENMLLIQTHPFANLIFDFERKQCKKHHEQFIKNQPLYGYDIVPKLFIPDIKDPIFVPAMLGWSSPAGNGSTDRVTQASSSANEGGRE